MEYEGKLLRVQGDEITFKLDREFDVAEAQRLTTKGVPRAVIYPIDERAMTKAQNGMIHGLFTDFSNHTGWPPDFAKELFKTMFAGHKNIESFSMEHYGISQVFAGEFIEYILDFYFKESIPFKYEKFHLGSDITRILFLYLKHRACFVCGEHHADVAHYEAVGAGRNRKKIDHSQHRFMALCRKHHNEQHTIGIETFMKKHILVPIKLTPEQIKEFKIGV
ncbi:putative HNHc nuclease [Carnobacterium jeotgali]|uniref:putative HNHc nuclease n=1 Tax=Carnobacterium jeotgali TaxID=545534 RepID=UPI0004931315|nr:putative HNHc nuclease [Carnobacterium jeotgali]